MPLLFSIAPIVLLIWMMTKRNGVPSYLALPLTAAVVYAVQLLWFDASCGCCMPISSPRWCRR